jgi:anion-transporting  ArsA/GET3 family ATPase
VTVDEVLAGKRICVCAGPGGVGKTSVAAAIGLGVAAAGARVCVLTIDPARRLAEALGLSSRCGDPCLVDTARLSAAGAHVRGELWATMLDAKQTWDGVVERYAPDARTRDAVLGNRIYRELSNAVSGTQEYMAMERLYELRERGGYDLVVVDTPPTRNALDFLDAPERLARFVDSRGLQLLLRPGRAGLRLFGRPMGAALSVLERITGVELLRDLSEFFGSFETMADDFRARAARVRAVLSEPATTFLVVTAPAPEAVEEAIFFERRLQERLMPFGGAVVNRVHAGAGDEQPAVAKATEELALLLGPDLGDRVTASWLDHRTLEERDGRCVARLSRELAPAPVMLVPHLDEDVHDLSGLVSMNRHLFGAEDQTGVP